jgi:hypothetical protein
MGAEDGSSSAIFVFLGASILLTLVSWSERKEPNVRNLEVGNLCYGPVHPDRTGFVAS